MSPPIVTSTGTVLVDCFQFLNEDGSELKPPRQQIGGGGLFAIIGALVFLSHGQARILADSDGNPPLQVREVQRVFGEKIFVPRPGRPTGSAVIVYRGGVRTFEYINQPPPISPRSFLGTPLERAQYIHMCASPADVLSTSAELDVIVREEGTQYRRAVIVWEPHPKFCLPEQREAFESCLRHVDVLSPNHEEAASIFSLPTPSTIAEYEALANFILHLPTLPAQTPLVLRAGALGSLVGTRDHGLRWVPSYWGSSAEEQKEVRDVTGAGNSFLGGLIAGLSLTGGDVYEAALYASVAASFIVQQFGLPNVERSSGGRSLWNGENPLDRLEKLRRRMEQQRGMSFT